MNTQSTPIHVRLWHRDFWLMSVANLLLSMSMTMLIPTMPVWMTATEGHSTGVAALAMLLFGIGVFLPGCLCSWLVQRFRRNMVCVWAVVALAVLTWIPMLAGTSSAMALCGLRLAQGACFGLAQMVLASTLIIDTCESHQRTEANHSATWFGRFALSLGPMMALVLYRLGGFSWVTLASVACLGGVVALVMLVRFPFRVPTDEVRVFSLDRFLLPNAGPLLANLLLATTAVGLLMALPLGEHFYGMVMVGFLLSLLAQRFVFPDAELKSEVVSGLLLAGASVLILISQGRTGEAVAEMVWTPQAATLSAPLLGLGLGLVGSRFLLFFIKLSRHCQRGTSQSTFILGWEGGIALGLGLGLWQGDASWVLRVSLVVLAAALLYYVAYVHAWFLKNKNR